MRRAWGWPLWLAALWLPAVGWGGVELPVVAAQRLLIGEGLEQPTAVAVDRRGRLYVADGVHHRVAVHGADGSWLFDLAGMETPMDVAVGDRDAVVVADSAAGRLVVFDDRGARVREIPLGDDGPRPPEPVAVQVEAGVVSWSDRANHRVCQQRLEDGEPIRCVGGPGEGSGAFRYPFALARDRDDYLYVSDVLNGRVQRFDPRGRYNATVSRFGPAPGELFRPNGIAVDRDDTLYVADSYLGTLSLFRRGRFLGPLRTADGATVRFDAPVGIAWNGGALYVVDAGEDRVWRLDLVPGTAEATGEAGAARASLSGKGCVACHITWDDRPGDDPRRVAEEGVPPVASERMCYSCHHGAVVDSRAAIGRGGQHPSVHHPRPAEAPGEGDGEREEAIPEAYPLSADGGLFCTSCHTPHRDGEEQQEVRYTGHANRWMRVGNRDGGLCGDCHESKLPGDGSSEGAPAGRNHPLGIRLAPPPRPGAEGYAREEALHHGLPAALAAGGAAVDGEARLICQSCHPPHGGVGRALLPLDNAESRLCAGCHQGLATADKREARVRGLHPVGVELEEPVEWLGERITTVTCESCHQVHAGSADTPLLGEGGLADLEAQCQRCHQRHFADGEEAARRQGVHPVNLELEQAVEIGGRPVKRVDCLSCHSVHGGEPGTAALVESDREGRLCARCHESQGAVAGSDHDLRLSARESVNRLGASPHQGGVCSACHTLHRGEPGLPFLFAAAPAEGAPPAASLRRDRLCFDCHREGGAAEKKPVEHFSHPFRDLVLRSDPETMPLLGTVEGDDGVEPVAEFGAIGCVTCHDPHRWRPADDRRPSERPADGEAVEGDGADSFLRLNRVEGIARSFCVDCHGVDTLLKYKYFHDGGVARNVGVDYLK